MLKDITQFTQALDLLTRILEKSKTVYLVGYNHPKFPLELKSFSGRELCVIDTVCSYLGKKRKVSSLTLEDVSLFHAAAEYYIINMTMGLIDNANVAKESIYLYSMFHVQTKTRLEEEINSCHVDIFNRMDLQRKYEDEISDFLNLPKNYFYHEFFKLRIRQCESLNQLCDLVETYSGLEGFEDLESSFEALVELKSNVFALSDNGNYVYKSITEDFCLQHHCQHLVLLKFLHFSEEQGIQSLRDQLFIYMMKSKGYAQDSFDHILSQVETMSNHGKLLFHFSRHRKQKGGYSRLPSQESIASTSSLQQDDASICVHKNSCK